MQLGGERNRERMNIYVTNLRYLSVGTCTMVLVLWGRPFVDAVGRVKKLTEKLVWIVIIIHSHRQFIF